MERDTRKNLVDVSSHPHAHIDRYPAIVAVVGPSHTYHDKFCCVQPVFLKHFLRYHQACNQLGAPGGAKSILRAAQNF